MDESKTRVEFGAFIRKKKDTDGLTVLPCAYLCCQLKIVQIARVKAGDIEELENPISNEKLYVWQDEPDHGLIVNVPFHHEYAEEANNLATELAEIAMLLSIPEYDAAKQEWTEKNQNPGAAK